MYTLRRWWDRYGLQIVLVGLAVSVALVLRQTNGAIVLELYQALSRPFQGQPAQPERLANARILELQQRLIELESRNQQLEQLLGFAATQSKLSIPAPVIGRSADHWWQQVLLGRGSRAGIKEGFVVTAPGGLVGRIEQVTGSTSRVLLLSDPSNRVGVVISRSRNMGVMRGQSSNRAVIEFFDKVPDVRRGDVVSTSAYSQFYPAGLPVGRIESINMNKSPAPEAIVELSAAVNNLEWVVTMPNQKIEQGQDKLPIEKPAPVPTAPALPPGSNQEGGQ